MYKINQISLFITVLFISCGTSKKVIVKNQDSAKNEYITLKKKYDSESDTYYYLTHIKHKNRNGKILKLEHAHAIETNGETVVNFAKRMDNPLLAMNASMGIKNLGPDRKQTVGIQIINGVIVQDLSTRTYTLGIKDNNELLAYSPGTTAQDILKDGTNNALTGFVPLILNHEPVGEDVLKIVGNNAVKHPRQVIAQFENLDLLILSCGGRGFDGQGMTAKDLIRILLENKVKFAFNLDGGGSVTTIIEGERITKQIDGDGTEDRPRSNFLYIK